jgi:PDZ domain-containing protein
VLLGGALFLVPIPYFIFGPGAAVDLNRAIIVPGHSSPPAHFYLTDVDLLPGRPAFYITAKILPGFEIIRRRDLVPSNMSDRDLDNELVDAMRESQTNAQIVAERAAGLLVKVSSSFVVIKTLPSSPAERCFEPGDKIVKVNGQSLRDPGQLSAVAASKPAGARFTMTLMRKKHILVIVCTTFRYKGKVRFGVTGTFQTEAYSLPIHVQYRLSNINGSSAGLMFALQIYRTIESVDLSSGRDVAGTGVLNAEGKVLPIEGAREKVRAAIKAHAAIFLVPRPNYADIRNTQGITIVPVTSFQEALRSLRRYAVSSADQGYI